MKENTKVYHFFDHKHNLLYINYENHRICISCDNLTNNMLKDIVNHNYHKALEDYECKLEKEIFNSQRELKQVKQFRQLLEKES